MAQISKNVTAVLLVITILISVVGTLLAIGTFTIPGEEEYQPMPVGREDLSKNAGKVFAYVIPPPPKISGEVTAYVLES